MFFFSKLQTPVGAVIEKNINFPKSGIERKSKDLYITTASTLNSLQHNDTFQFLENIFQKRTRSDKQIWLVGMDFDLGNR